MHSWLHAAVSMKQMASDEVKSRGKRGASNNKGRSNLVYESRYNRYPSLYTIQLNAGVSDDIGDIASNI